MIFYVEGDLFESPAKVLVNTVNTKGVMGKGIALQFKRIYPEMFKVYRHYCENGRFTIGTLQVYRSSNKWILNFPTKRHWREPSRVQYIEAGLRNFVNSYVDRHVASVAFPALGCGNGELDFEMQVRPLMERYLKPIRIPTFLYPPRPRTNPPEHRNIREIKRWLRSEPSALPFNEVWDDLVELLGHRREFQTHESRQPYTVDVGESSFIIRDNTIADQHEVEREDLLEFWQQLRDFGLVHAGLVPKYHRARFLIPVFEQLPYVRPVAVSAPANYPQTKPEVGLLSVPPSLVPDPLTTGLFAPMIDGT